MVAIPVDDISCDISQIFLICKADFLTKKLQSIYQVLCSNNILDIVYFFLEFALKISILVII